MCVCGRWKRFITAVHVGKREELVNWNGVHIKELKRGLKLDQIPNATACSAWSLKFLGLLIYAFSVSTFDFLFITKRYR